ncbi:hypothetical protein GGR56DRAFT_662992 [Xylariaceae sp. FL0804]|nr:hypothetical protein GGR56DRAFT_662992 [Xylariaceae sp. FL0804]
MTPSYANSEEPSVADQSSQTGPALGAVTVGRQYFYEKTIRRKLAALGDSRASQENYRFAGIQLIHEVRVELGLPVKTFNAASTFFHQLLLRKPGHEHNWDDTALASLKVACKTEDTLKKSREILVAAYNLRNPEHMASPDDKIFEQSSRVMIGLERIMMEVIQFDFRVRSPQQILTKLMKRVLVDHNSDKFLRFYNVAFAMSIDMYKTFAPLKYPSWTCGLMLVQLTALFTGDFVDEFMALDPTELHSKADWVAEVMLDVLELYTQQARSTLVGTMVDGQTFIDVKIRVNKQVDEKGIQRYQNQCPACEPRLHAPALAVASPRSPDSADEASKQDPQGHKGTKRFQFDPDEARLERQKFREYNEDVWEKWEEEVEEAIAEPNRPPREPRGGPRGGHAGHGRGGWRGGRADRRRRGGRGFY